MQQQALSALIAWVRLERAIDDFNAQLKREHGITGLQLAVLRILAERPRLPLSALRRTLVMHPATLGQAIDALRAKGLCRVEKDARDRRARLVSITPQGARTIALAPLAGPVRLRQVEGDPQQLEALAAAFSSAIDLFGLADWDPARKESDNA